TAYVAAYPQRALRDVARMPGSPLLTFAGVRPEEALTMLAHGVRAHALVDDAGAPPGADLSIVAHNDDSTSQAFVVEMFTRPRGPPRAPRGPRGAPRRGGRGGGGGGRGPPRRRRDRPRHPPPRRRPPPPRAAQAEPRRVVVVDTRRGSGRTKHRDAPCAHR